MQTRAQWGARSPKTALTYVAPARRTEFFVHYEGAHPLTQEHSGCAAKVREFQIYHQGTNGWSDIGYNLLVCQHGEVFEGRGWDYVGAHCPDHNTSGYGVQVMIGGSQEPTAEALAACRRLYDEACARSGKALDKKGHRDGFATACPGEALYRWVKDGMPAGTDSPASAIPEVFEKPAPAPAPKPKPTPKPAGGLDVKLIDLRDVSPLVRGAGVKPLQRLLGVPADGLGGPGTRAALGAAQRRCGLTVDYVFGPATAEALLAGK